MNDILVNHLLIVNNKINTHYKQIINKNNELLEYLNNRYTDSESLLETIYRIQYNIDIRPVCKCCGKHVNFAYGFKDFCSKSCSKLYILNNNKTNINDLIIIDDYFSNGVINNNKLLNKYIAEHGYTEYLKNRYTDSYSNSETIYRIIHKIELKKICSVCGKSVRLKNFIEGFDTVCSDICKRKETVPEITEEYLKSLNIKGGVYKESWRGYWKANLYLQNRYGDEYRDYHEAMYMCLHDMNKIPRCPVCGEKVLFRPNKNADKSCYTLFCSLSCNNLNVINQTILKYKDLSGFDISYDKSDDSYIFKNVCNIHKEFKLSRIDAHNRCGNGRILYMQICPICNPERNLETSIEKIVRSILDDLNLTYEQHVRNIISPKELDFYLPDKNVAIECNGMFWHSDIKKEKLYHYDKFNECNSKGIYLLNLWEDEIINNYEYVKLQIKNICNIGLLCCENYDITNNENTITLKCNNDIVISCVLTNNKLNMLYTNDNYFISYNDFSRYVNYIILLVSNDITILINVDNTLFDYFIKFGFNIQKYMNDYFYYDVRLNKRVSKSDNNIFKCYDVGKYQLIYKIN